MTAALPSYVRELLREADRRIEEFWLERTIPAFVPSDYPRVYQVLRAMVDEDIAPGSAFCEWGSGFGVVASLAATLGLDACGIEIEEQLVDAARLLADDFGVEVEFICGSFIPEGCKTCLDACGGLAWLTTHRRGVPEELPYAPDDFDVIFAYPWPGEEDVIGNLFEDHAGQGSLLVTYHGGDDIRLRRKVERKPRRRRKPR